MVVAPRPLNIALACMGSTFSFKIELSPAFWQGDQIRIFVVVTPFSLLFHIENRHLVPYVPLKMILGVHFLRENEGSQKFFAYLPTLWHARFHLTRKKPMVSKHRF